MVAGSVEGSQERGSQDGGEEAPARPLTRRARVLTYNVLAGGWPRRVALEAVIRDARADLVGMQEVAPETLEELASRLGMYAAYGPSRRGMAVGLLSRWPLRETLPHPDAPLHNALLEAVVAPEGAAPLRVFVVHLVASYMAWRANEGARLREIAYVLDRMAQARARRPDEGSLLLGDFNSLPPGEPLLAGRLLRRVAVNDRRRARGEDMRGQPGVDSVLPEPLRPLGTALAHLVGMPAVGRACDALATVYVPRAVIRHVRATGYRDLYARAHPDPREREMSCPALDPAGRIDYIFADRALATRLTRCDLLADSPTCPVAHASDHRPMLAELALPLASDARG